MIAIDIKFVPDYPFEVDLTSETSGDRLRFLPPQTVLDVELQNIMRGPQGVPGSVDSLPILTGQALVAGNFVNVYNDGGLFKVRRATSHLVGREANGYVLAGYSVGDTAVVFFNGTNTSLVALTPGVKYLGVNGAVTDTPPEGTGVIQIIGTAAAANALHFQPSFPVVLFGTPS